VNATRSCDYGHAFRVIRAANGLDQREVAILLGMTAGHVSLIESGKRLPSLETLHAFARAMDVPVSAVVYLAERRLRGVFRAAGIVLKRSDLESPADATTDAAGAQLLGSNLALGVQPDGDAPGLRHFRRPTGTLAAGETELRDSTPAVAASANLDSAVASDTDVGPIARTQSPL
jgi:transcriptional regulator with XRE-family HTH domain